MKKQQVFPLILFLFVLIGFSSCSKDEADEELPTPTNPTNPSNPTNECDTDDVTFTGTVQAILNGSCTGCHGGAAPLAGIDLTNHAGVKAVADNGKLLGAIKHEGGFAVMPQGGGQLPDCDIAQIEKWIENGAEND